MLAHAQEVDQTLELIAEAKKQLEDRCQAFDPNIRVGAMIEVPAAALALSIFIKRLDFISIGTNDLIQYTLAIDRADNAVAHLYDPYHPAVLRLIASVIAQAKRAGVPVSICGEMAGELDMTKILLGMGLTDFSMHFNQILSIKKEILRSDISKLRSAVQELLELDEAHEQLELIEKIKTL
jgi:phosphotransferase system enzyme I (PtsI)